MSLDLVMRFVCTGTPGAEQGHENGFERKLYENERKR